MMAQQLGFDLDEGKRLREDGQATALANLEEEAWPQQAAKAILRQSGQFTADDIVAIIGLPRGIPGQNANNAVGAVFSALCKKRMIRPCGYTKATRVTSHARTVRVWIRL